MSRVCRSVNDEPSVKRYCIVSTLVVSMVGAYTSERTPPATGDQIFEDVLRAVPRQSLRARSKWLSVPGPPPAGAAEAGGGATAASEPASVAATVNPTSRACLRISRLQFATELVDLPIHATGTARGRQEQARPNFWVRP